jgi:hypothetical protein
VEPFSKFQYATKPVETSAALAGESEMGAKNKVTSSAKRVDGLFTFCDSI